MKFFNWMQSKFNGAQGRNATSTAHYHVAKQEPRKEEFSDWPQGLLTIGTFGNNNNNEHLPIHENEEEINYNQETDQATTETSSPDLSDFTPEEVGKLQKELTNLLSCRKKQDMIPGDLPLDRFLNCPSSLEVDRRLSMRLNGSEGGGNDDKEEIDRTIRVILGRCKDICTDNTKKAIIGKKSISFLFKKIFVCSSGFPTSSIPSTLRSDHHHHHHPLPESRMEKLLRAMLKNKINNPQNSQSSSARKFIESSRRSPCRKGEAEEDISTKWVKTDSECE
uniref:protein NEGATIVE GRAVITROPIC RESPONSE OF ROOTS n=1 Tax=Erigeron canadensis TaxID=72917 RepID=UPI001CB97F11|nr:protein NEGATIVE GRAVITROPIC RESPONSE OF ROOTS [Erigeron canadensis]